MRFVFSLLPLVALVACEEAELQELYDAELQEMLAEEGAEHDLDEHARIPIFNKDGETYPRPDDCHPMVWGLPQCEAELQGLLVLVMECQGNKFKTPSQTIWCNNVHNNYQSKVQECAAIANDYDRHCN